ncbi:hypothetical protein SAMN02745857_02607 [Andreprevotia lacus DSM 23236]|jgi:hypothetical protein|uniref:Lipoprotein n=1 Tax=Andreprevotia lacus DSM 23236 TaxID=1121001 RepID=A0A1W1XSK5_9NEIS|nr:surface-adhesin E family protein [Andreprevotia lacus]SMC26835.1 hypothetical protein SAMN02745857_02607 [Andreprevotia lacus DSM 23236]
MKPLAVLLVCLLLVACGKFDDKLDGPSPVPEKNAEWRKYGTMPDFEMWVDAESVSHNADEDKGSPKYTYVWMWQKFKADQVDGQSKGKYRNKYTRQAIDCPSGRMAGIAVELRDEDGVEVARYDVPGYQWEFADQPADSYGGDFVRQVCKIMTDKEAKKKSEE